MKKGNPFELLIILFVIIGIFYYLKVNTSDMHEEWIEAHNSGSAVKLKRFQNKYPDSVFEDYLKVKLWYAEKEIWENRFDTIDKCRTFINEHGEKPVYRLLIKIIMVRADLFRFNEIKSSPTIDKLEKFIKSKPAAEIKEKAHLLLLKFKSKEILVEENQPSEEYRPIEKEKP
ncbi:hypothetical protein KAJ27_08775 [bacterium]|nr:hypothetical protein [bacterium]